jgi:Domain of unknown function (DUF6321)
MKTFSKLREEISEACWKGYKQVGGKMKGGKMVPNCVPTKEGVAQGSTAHDCKHCNGKGYHTVTKKDGTKVATNCPQCKGKGYIVTKGVAEGYHTSTIAAIAAHAYTPKVGDKIRTRMGGQIPGEVTKVTDKHVYFTHPEGKKYKTHISNVRLDEEVEQVKPVLHNGKKIGETGVDTEASPGNGKWYAKHYESGRNTVGFNSREEAKAEVHAAHGIDEEVEQLDERGANKYKRPTEKGAGLTRAGVMKYRRENPGSKLSTAVTTEPSKLKHGSKAWNRRKSFCARMSGVKGPMKDSKGRPTRKAMSLRRWHCEE